VVTNVAALLSNNTNGYVHCYAAKNATFNTANRVVFGSGEGTIAHYIDTDPQATTPIAAYWELKKGDRLVIAFTNGGSSAIRASITATIRFLQG
jgi:hypothetical protein